MDRAVSAIYEPGSTFKLVTLAAAFDQKSDSPRGSFQLRERLDCRCRAPDSRSQDIWRAYGGGDSGEFERCWSDQDCAETGSAKIQRIHSLVWVRFSDRVDLPGESRGLVQRLDHWGSFSIGSISMGQEVGVTPLQMINAVSAVANGGLLYSRA